MAEEIIKYENKVKRLLIGWQYSSHFKIGPKKVKVTTSSIVITGKGIVGTSGQVGATFPEKVEMAWDVTIPFDSIVNIHLESFKAEGAMHYHRDAVGIEARLDGVLLSYAIFTSHPHDLFQIIQSSKHS